MGKANQWCLTSLVIRKMQIKTTMRCHFIPIRNAIIKKILKSVVEDVEKLEPKYITNGNVTGCSQLGNQLTIVKKLNIGLPAIDKWPSNFTPRYLLK